MYARSMKIVVDVPVSSSLLLNRCLFLNRPQCMWMYVRSLRLLYANVPVDVLSVELV